MNQGGHSVWEHVQNQLESSGSNPTRPLHYLRIGKSAASSFVKKHHYSHSHPGGIDFCFGIRQEDVLVGASMFGYMAGNPKGMCVCEGIEDASRYRELMRLVLIDELPKNSESRFIGWCLRWLKKHTELAAIISFADPKYGHTGVIYKASNWIYTGMQKPDRPRIFLEHTDLFGTYEKEIHPRQAVDTFGSSSREAIGKSRLSPREPKHRFVYFLRPGLKLKARMENISYGAIMQAIQGQAIKQTKGGE